MGRQAIDQALLAARAGNTVSDVSAAIQRTVEAAGHSVNRKYGGHGVGRSLFEQPFVGCFTEPRAGGVTLRAGMILSIHVIAHAGRERSNVKADGWTVVTSDGSRAIDFSQMIAITPGGPEILTPARPEGRRS